MEPYEPDMLDEATAFEAHARPEATAEWEATKTVALLRKARFGRGLTPEEVAARMGLTPSLVIEIEENPWLASFGQVVAYARAVGAEVGIVGDLSLAA